MKVIGLPLLLEWLFVTFHKGLYDALAAIPLTRGSGFPEPALDHAFEISTSGTELRMMKDWFSRHQLIQYR